MKYMMLALILLLAATDLPQTPKTEPKPLDKVQGLALLGGVPSKRRAMLVDQRGTDFEPREDYLNTLKGAGAEEVLLNALRTSHPAPAPEDRLFQNPI